MSWKNCVKMIMEWFLQESAPKKFSLVSTIWRVRQDDSAAPQYMNQMVFWCAHFSCTIIAPPCNLKSVYTEILIESQSFVQTWCSPTPHSWLSFHIWMVSWRCSLFTFIQNNFKSTYYTHFQVFIFWFQFLIEHRRDSLRCMTLCLSSCLPPVFSILSTTLLWLVTFLKTTETLRSSVCVRTVYANTALTTSFCLINDTT